MRTLLIIFFISIIVMAGCAGFRMKPYPAESVPPAGPVLRDPTTRAAVAQRAKSDRLIKAEAEVRLQTEEPDGAHRAIIDLGERYGGHLLYSDLQKTRIRLPEQKLFAALAEIESLGKLLDRRIVGTDVTEQYKVVSEQFAQLMRQRGRLVAEIDRATDLSVRKELEAELDAIDASIAQLGVQQDAEAHEIYYALVEVETTQKRIAGPLGWLVSNALLGVKKLFVLN